MILVVGDDASFIEQACSVLDQKWRVLVANDAVHALGLIESIGDGLSIALIDLDLAQGDGSRLIRRVHDTAPRVQVIATADRLSAEEAEHARHLGAAEVISKPITTQWNIIMEILRERRGPN